MDVRLTTRIISFDDARCIIWRRTKREPEKITGGVKKKRKKCLISGQETMDIRSDDKQKFAATVVGVWKSKKKIPVVSDTILYTYI